MHYFDHPLHRSIVRIRTLNGAIVGTGFLVTQKLVCTCAHVVAAALDLPPELQVCPGDKIHLDFPFINEISQYAYIESWQPIRHDGSGDIAVLRLMTAPPADACPARLLSSGVLSGKRFEVCGFPNDNDAGIWVQGELVYRRADNLIQIEDTKVTGYRIQSGFSGAPVWSVEARGVIGMVVAAERDPRVKAGFIIPTSLIHRLNSTIRTIDVRFPFAILTDGLVGLSGNPLIGIEQFLREYIGIPSKPAPFGGRLKQIKELDSWLAQPSKPYALLVARAGRGKSALLARWVYEVAQQNRADVVFVPVSIRFGTALKSITLGMLGARLRYLHNVNADPPRNSEMWLTEIDHYLREDRAKPLLIVIDGVDEAVDWVCGRDLRFPPAPGHAVKVLVSARTLIDCDTVGWLRQLEWVKSAISLALPALDRQGIAEALLSMGNPLAEFATQVDLISELFRLTQGDPLLVRLYVEALRGSSEHSAFLKPDDLQELRPGLDDYFNYWWNDQLHLWGNKKLLKEPTVRILLNLFACALGPLLIDDLSALTALESFDRMELEEALRPLSRFVVGDGQTQGYVFSHPRLNQYFYEEKLSKRDRENWENRFLNYGQQTLEALTSGKLSPTSIPSYILKYYGAHLKRAGATPENFYALVCQEWQQAWEAFEGTHDGFLIDLGRAWRCAEEIGTNSQNIEERPRAIGLQCRYMLITASINSLAQNISPKLLLALVEYGLWTPVQALAYIRRTPDEYHKSDALIALMQYLPETMLEEAFTTARMIKYEWLRARTLAQLAPYLLEIDRPVAYTEALAAIQAIVDDDSRVQQLLILSSYLPDAERLTVLSKVPLSPSTLNYWGSAELSTLPEELLRKILAEVRATENTRRHLKSLVSLALHLTQSEKSAILDEVLNEVPTIEEEIERLDILKALAAYLPMPDRPNLLNELLGLTYRMESDYCRATVLAELVPHLPIPMLHKTLAVAYKIDGS